MKKSIEPNEPIVTMNDIRFSYENKVILDDVNFELPKGKFMGLIGPNGGGKSTLIKIMLGLLKPQHGTIKLFGTPIEKFHEREKIGFVSQKANSFNRGFPATVFEVVSTGLTAKLGYFRYMNKDHKKQVLHAIDQVGMLDYKYENIGSLSGGQQQRVFIARALVNKPELLILDEPTVGIDRENVKRFYDLLHHLNYNRGITMLLVTHDTGIMTEYATDIVCLNKTLHFHGDPSEYSSLSEKDLSLFYGHRVNTVVH